MCVVGATGETRARTHFEGVEQRRVLERLELDVELDRLVDEQVDARQALACRPIVSPAARGGFESRAVYARTFVLEVTGQEAVQGGGALDVAARILGDQRAPAKGGQPARERGPAPL